MRALVKTHAKPGLWLEEKPKPTIKPHEVLIKVEKAAICGTDIHIYQWDAWAQKVVKPGTIIGHEFVGTIAEVGEIVEGLKVGDRVSGEGHITCGHCRNCRAGTQYLCRNTIGTGSQRDGAFAEYIKFPAANAFKIPDDISSDLASIFDPFGNAVHTALSFNLVGEDVLITGAGPIGIMAVAIAKHVGARHVVITDVNEFRLDLAKKMGATRTINPQTTSLKSVMTELGMTEGFDVGLEMSGHQDAFRSMLETMNHGGKIALLGIFPNQVAIDWNHVIFKGLILKGIYGREMYETWYKMVSMLQSGLNISPVITHRFPMADYETAFQHAMSGKAGKVILEW